MNLGTREQGLKRHGSWGPEGHGESRWLCFIGCHGHRAWKERGSWGILIVMFFLRGMGCRVPRTKMGTRDGVSWARKCRPLFDHNDRRAIECHWLRCATGDISVIFRVCTARMKILDIALLYRIQKLTYCRLT